MPIKRLNEFPEGSGSLTNDDVFIFMDNPTTSGVTKKVSLNALKTIIGSSSIDDPPFDDNTYGRKNGEWIDLAAAAALQFRQGTNADRLAMSPVPAMGEPIYTTDSKRLFIGDGTTTGGRSIVGDTNSYIICQPGDDIIQQYNKAKALTPNGSALSSTNRASLIIYPGSYPISSGWLVDTDFVDVIGLGSSQWNAQCFLTVTGGSTTISANDIDFIGINTATIIPGSGGSSRFLINCVGGNIYHCPILPMISGSNTSGIPNIIKGTLIGCYGTTSIAGGPGGTAINVFDGNIINCRSDAFVCRNTVFQGDIKNLHFSQNSTFNSFRGFQGRISYSHFTSLTSGTLWPRSSNGGSILGAFTGTCTISQASPAIVTKSSHGLTSGMRIRFSTTDSLPAGLDSTTTYYVQVLSSSTFQVSTTINGSSINTTSAGSGSHSIVIPPGIEGGRFSYCLTSDGEFTSP